MSYLFYLGVAVIAVLAGVALYYQVLVLKKNSRDKKSEAEVKQALEERRKRNENSIQVIARAVIDDQVTLTEASIRINAISQAMNLEAETLNALLVFRQVAEATSHIPILEQWQKLSRKEQVAYDVERIKIEDNFRDFADEAAKKIVRGETSLS